ncbi:MBL fold metallo-hydrolase [Mycobacterium shimoidei]|uniref:MBL fold metallo-hydrolase n=1 Tax=Mycobacterium shimoidei TaxID=29313 RepID=UPI000B3135C0|nr:MBL fold metallo-hydrolase [Mycobacterium shimoidei]MCV7258459.1 MBL fold metallo-hydrolase [Mycobacterium shimoidei]
MLRGALRLAAGTATLAGSGWMLRALHGAPTALGAAPAAIRAAAERSPNLREGVFVNPEPASVFSIDREQQRLILREIIGGRAATRPAAPIPMELPRGLAGVAEDIAVCWLGHATVLVELDGYRVLTDPIWSERCSPSDVIGPQRMHPPPTEVEGLPALDAIVISHDHYDHLDTDTVVALARTQRAPFVVPLGVGAHLRAWGIPGERIIELDWNEVAQVDELRLVCTPARHFSGRFLSRNTTLWASWALIGPRHRAYFAGDTGYTKSFAAIGAAHGPFDVTLMPVGAYNKAWPDIHMNPEEAVRAHLDVGGRLLVPIHWCTFRLAPHPWAEPIERLLAAAESSDVEVSVPKPGGRTGPSLPATHDPWWRS